MAPCSGTSKNQPVEWSWCFFPTYFNTYYKNLHLIFFRFTELFFQIEVIDVLLDAPQFYCQTFLGLEVSRGWNEAEVWVETEIWHFNKAQQITIPTRCLIDMDIFGRCFIKYFNRWCMFFLWLGWRGTIETTVVSCYVSSELSRRDSSWGWPPDRCSTSCFGCRGGIGGETSTGWRWRFPGENALTIQVHSLDDSSQWCLVGRIFFFGVFYQKIFLRRHFNLMKQHFGMLEHIFWKLPQLGHDLSNCQISSWAHFHQLACFLGQIVRVSTRSWWFGGC